MRLIITFVLIFMLQFTFAQESVSSFGLRAGGGNGLTFKYVEDYRYGVEAIVSYRDDGFQATGLWLKYKPFMTDRIRDFYFFSGFGAHAGYIRAKENFCVEENGNCVMRESRKTRVVGGLDGVIGFEYYFHTVPMSVSLDYKPYLEFFGEEFFRVDLWDFGFSFRYTF